MSLLSAGVQALQLYIHKASIWFSRLLQTLIFPIFFLCRFAVLTYLLQCFNGDIVRVPTHAHRMLCRMCSKYVYVLCLSVNPLDSLNIFQSVRNSYVFPLIHNSVYLWAALCRHIYLFFHFRFSSHSYKLLYHIIMWHSSTDFHLLK